MDVGVIGVGAMGKNHARVYTELRSIGSVYIYDVNQDLAHRIAVQYGTEVCTSLDTLLRKAEAVSICVPTKYHFSVATQTFSHGVHALIEKPICQDSAEGKHLMEIMPKDLTVGVGHIERFNPIVDEIKRIMKDPLYIEMKRHNPTSSRITDSSVIEDLMIHDIDIAFNVLFSGEYSLSSAGTLDICAVLIRIAQTPLYLSASRRAAKKIRTIYIEEEDRTIEGNFMTQELVIYRKPGQFTIENQRYVQESVIETVLVNKVEPLKLELSTFLTCVQMGKPFPVTPDQAIRNLGICEEIRQRIV